MLTATNQHGVHSPFIYGYVTKCVYSKPKYKGSKSIDIVLKSIRYFSAKHIKIISESTKIANRIQQEFGLISTAHSLYDMMYFEDISEGIKLLGDKSRIYNNTVVICDNIHKNKTNTSLWEKAKQLEKVTVTIDFFYCGAIFFRKEQAKEHFKIRI